jgi:glutathione S-transferase
MATKVMAARKQYGVKYPDLYADPNNKNAKLFNCVQRGHQNSLENLPTFYTLMILSGLKYPVYTAIAGLFYNAGRVLYLNGYATGDPKKRMQGGIMYIGTLGLLGMAGSFAYTLLRS